MSSTGHSIWRRQARADPFPNWHFEDFTGYDINREKLLKPGKVVNDAANQGDPPPLMPRRRSAQSSQWGSFWQAGARARVCPGRMSWRWVMTVWRWCSIGRARCEAVVVLGVVVGLRFGVLCGV